MNERKRKILNPHVADFQSENNSCCQFQTTSCIRHRTGPWLSILMVYVLDVSASNRILPLLTSLSGCKTLITDPILPLRTLNFPFPQFPQSSHLSLAFHLSETQDICQHNIFLVLRIFEVDHQGSTMLY